jgi:Kdo2-lipid IVA lauroyltransferase/acyltransferase
MQIIAEVILGLLAWIYFLLPRFLRQIWENLLGFIFRKLNWRLKVIEQNLAIARQANAIGPELGVKEIYHHMAQVILEILLLFGPKRKFLKDEVDLEGFDFYIEAAKKNKGVIMLGSHLGNWEAMAAKGAENGMNVMIVTKHLKPEWVHRMMEKARARALLKGTYEPRTFKDVLRHLKGNGAVGMVIDQFVGAPVGVRVPFFGVPVGTQSAIALIVKRTGAVVLPCLNYFDFKRGRRVVRIEAPIDWQEHSNPDYEIALNTFRYSRAIEEFVKRHPSEWLWTHRRFKGDLSPLRAGEWTEGRARK